MLGASNIVEGSEDVMWKRAPAWGGKKSSREIALGWPGCDAPNMGEESVNVMWRDAPPGGREKSTRGIVLG